MGGGIGEKGPGEGGRRRSLILTRWIFGEFVVTSLTGEEGGGVDCGM